MTLASVWIIAMAILHWPDFSIGEKLSSLAIVWHSDISVLSFHWVVNWFPDLTETSDSQSRHLRDHYGVTNFLQTTMFYTSTKIVRESDSARSSVLCWRRGVCLFLKVFCFLDFSYFLWFFSK